MIENFEKQKIETLNEIKSKSKLDLSNYVPHSIEYHKTRLRAMFEYRGIHLSKYTLTLYAEICANPFWLTDFDESIKHLDLLAELMQRDRDNGIIL